MSRESVWNVLGCCGLSERTIRRAVCQHHGQKNPETLTKKTSRDCRETSSRDILIKSSRDSHHHSLSHILYEHRNLVETPAHSYII